MEFQPTLMKPSTEFFEQLDSLAFTRAVQDSVIGVTTKWDRWMLA
jgi:hypothetical protein